jgi:Tol biopolymer transport system component/tRNA A-37 threonylcarbamoyl transferase component Bud32
MSITPERQRQIEQLYRAVLDREIARRHEFLIESSVGDEGLRREVEAMLAQSPFAVPADGTRETLTTDQAKIRGVSAFPILEAGSRLGPYEILGVQGRGGMGVVYKARDTRLGRVVVIKIYRDPVLGRFEREARAISALNHPHICTLYDVGPDYMVMEFIEGPTLAEWLRKGRLPVEQVLRYGAQVADALMTAHAQGIIHRDLKPGNIMVTANGVKVLDFGLAKYAPDAAPGSFDTSLTATGAIVGTPAYMAPEQLEGRECDARTDIFAFGLVLYEMATGKRAFHASSQAELIAHVMRCEPPLDDFAPPELALLVERCLAKDRLNRWQTASDLKLQIEWIEKSLTAPRAAATSAESIKRRQMGGVVAAVLVLAVLIVIACLGWWWMERTRQQLGGTLKLIPLTTYPGVEQQPSLSPDGSQVAFTWNGPDQKNFDIYVKAVGPGPPLRLTTDPADDINPTWSPDGGSIAFMRKMSEGNQYRVLLIPALGGPERKLTDVSIGGTGWQIPPYLSWLPDSRSLVITDRFGVGSPTALFLLSAVTGERRQLTFPPAGTLGDHCAAASPDGKALAFRRANAQGQWRGSIYVVALDSGFKPQREPRQVTPQKFFDWSCVAWTADSQRLVFPYALGLWTLPVSAQSGTLVGGSAKMAVDSGDGVDWLSVSHTSARLAYARKTGGGFSIWRIRIPGAHEKLGQPERFIASTKGEFAQQYSPDGTKIAFESYRGGNLEIWVCSSEGEDCIQLTTMGAPQTGLPAWSPDGRQIAFYSNQEGKSQIFVIPADGGAVRRMTSGSASAMFARWSRDGKWIYFSSKDTGPAELWKVPASGGPAVQVTHGGGFASSESLDGKWLYFMREFGSDNSLWKKPVDGGEETQVLPSVIYTNFAIMDDGIYYVTKTEQGFAIEFLNFVTGKSDIVAPIGKGYVGLSVSPDRKWISFSQENPLGSELVLVEGFR